VNFRETDTYPRATAYICEPSAKKSIADLDPSPLVSRDHPPLAGRRRTTDATPPADEAVDMTDEKRRKLRKMTPEEFYNVVVDQGLQTRADVMEYAKVDRRLVGFSMTYGRRLDEFLRQAHELMRGGRPPERPTRGAKLGAAAASGCVCGGHWGSAATAVLRVQGLQADFAVAMARAIESGRNKGCNVWLSGATNRGKTLLLSGLSAVFAIFENPAEGSFNLENLPGHDCVILDDFRVEENLLPWRVLLLWLDGRKFNIRMPRTGASPGDVAYTETAPIFVCSKGPPIRRRYGEVDTSETGQLQSRFCVLHFEHNVASLMAEHLANTPPQYLDESKVHIRTCARCFADLLGAHA